MVLPCWYLRRTLGSVDQLGCHRTSGTVGGRDIWRLDRLVARSISGADPERFGGLPSDRISNSLLWARILLHRGVADSRFRLVVVCMAFCLFSRLCTMRLRVFGAGQSSWRE
jgi:hypothetical protein